MAVPGAAPIARVKINVGAANEQVKSEIERCLAQSLQGLDNVQVVDETPRWTIEVVTALLDDGEGHIEGIGMSFVILEHGPQMQMLVTMAQAWRYVMAAGFLQDKFIEQGMRQLVGRVDALAKTRDLTVFSQHRMCVIPLDRIGLACQDIAATLDTQFLRPSMLGAVSVANDSAQAAPRP
jgi:hypothetical protein